MISANFSTRGGMLDGFTVKGHAGYARSGRDIVCSAVSVVAHMTALGLTQVLPLHPTVSQSDGFMSLRLPPDEITDAQTLLRTMEKEMQSIAGQYPAFVHVTYAERRE